MSPAFTHRFAGKANVVSGADQVFERMLEVLCQVQPLPCVEIEVIKDCRRIIRKNGPSLRVGSPMRSCRVAHRLFGTTKLRSARLAWPHWRANAGHPISVNRPWFKVVGQSEGRALRHGIPEIARKGHQFCWLLVDSVG
jgi:hypothetical protein